MRKTFVVLVVFMLLSASSAMGAKGRAVRSAPPFEFKAAMSVQETAPGAYAVWHSLFNHLSIGDEIEWWIVADGKVVYTRLGVIYNPGGPWSGQIFAGTLDPTWSKVTFGTTYKITLNGQQRKYTVIQSISKHPSVGTGSSAKGAVVDENGGIQLIGFEATPTVVAPFWLNVALPVQAGNYIAPGTIGLTGKTLLTMSSVFDDKDKLYSDSTVVLESISVSITLP